MGINTTEHTARMSGVTARMRRRDQRSMTTPVNGSIREKGTISSVAAFATPTVVLWPSGDRNTSWLTRNDWNRPSANWLARRAARSMRKSREDRAARARATVPVVMGPGYARGSFEGTDPR